MAVSQAEILEKAVEVLRADPTLIALLGETAPASGEARVFNHVPQDDGQPYLAMLWQATLPYDTKDSEGFEGILEHEAVTTHHGDRDALKIMDAVRAAYSAAPIALLSGRLICFDYQRGSNQANVFETHRATAIFSVLVDADGVGGAPVPPPVGAKVAVKDEGVALANSPNDCLNFKGDGVEVTPGPGGEACITIAGSAGGLVIANGKGIGNILFQQAVAGVKSNTQSTMTANPLNNDSIKFFALYDSLGNEIVGPALEIEIFFKAVIAGGGNHFIVPTGADVLIGVSANATLQNLIGALNDPLISDLPGVLHPGWTASNSGGDILNMEHDFTGSFPNLLDSLSEQIGMNFTPPIETWKNGVNGNPATPTPQTVFQFHMELESTGPSIIVDFGPTIGVKLGTQLPESVPIVVGDDIIDVANLAFVDVPHPNFAKNGIIYRGIFIPPTEDAVAGTAVVSWTFKGTLFEVFVTKVVL